MSWREATIDGVVLAAAVQEDESLRSVLTHCVEGASRRVERRARWLRELDAPSKRAALMLMARRLSPPLSDETQLPPRALALLALDAPREVARRWQAGAPMPRPGYRPEPALKALLRRWALQAVPEDPQVADEERGAGRSVMAALLAEADDLERRKWSALCGQEEAAAVARLHALGGLVVPSGARAWIRAAERIAERGTIVRVLGAIRLGWEQGPDGGDGRSARWRRIGAQLRDLEESGCLA